MTTPATKRDEPLKKPGRLQKQLLAKAEKLLGPRSKRQIALPKFEATGPRIRHAPDGSTVHAELSLGAAGSQQVAVYELAHEVVHLLDPVEGHTNYLEEGVAVAFAVEMSRLIGGREMQPTKFPQYMEAWRLVRELSGDVYAAAKKIRRRCGALSKATADDLAALFPDRDIALLKKLTTTCVPR